jgi:hypothetical protein
MIHEVGDIVYLLSRKNHKIVPAMVESVTTIKKIAGIDVTHEMSIPGAPPTQKIVLENLDVDVFKGVQPLREHMLKIAQEKVNNDIVVVEELVRSAWPTADTHHSNTEMQIPELFEKETKKPSVVKVQLPDGSTANVQMPSELI